MKTIPLTHGLVTMVDDDMFDELNAHKWYVHFYRTQPSAVVRELRLDSWRGSEFMHHRVLSPPPGMIIDHIDRNPLNNQRSNLRIATQAENTRNSRGTEHTSRYKGVNWDTDRNKWAVFIRLNDKCRFIGRFVDEEDAALAYNVAAQLFYGEFAFLNPV